MKISAKVSDLAAKLKKVQSVIPAKVTIPILEYAKLDVTAIDRATLTGSDLGMSMIQTVPIQLLSTETGSMLVKARVLSEILAALPGEAEIVIERTEDGAVHASAGKLLKRAKLAGANVTLFPALDPRPATQFNINAAAMKKVLTRVDVAAPAKAGRHSVASVLFESTTGQLRAAATDGSRIAVATAPGAGAGEFSIQIPKDFLPLLKDMTGEVVQFSQSETNFFFATESETLLIRIPTTKFPNFSKVFATTEFKTTFEFAIPSLKSALAIVKAVSDSKTPAVFLTVQGQELMMSSGNSDGEIDSVIDLKTSEGVPNKVKVNQNFVLDFLGQVEGSAKVQLIDAQSLIKFSVGEEYLYFLMPMIEQVKEETTEKAKAGKKAA
jgi:DNA polymerase III beta subunit